MFIEISENWIGHIKSLSSLVVQCCYESERDRKEQPIAALLPYLKFFNGIYEDAFKGAQGCQDAIVMLQRTDRAELGRAERLMDDLFLRQRKLLEALTILLVVPKTSSPILYTHFLFHRELKYFNRLQQDRQAFHTKPSPELEKRIDLIKADISKLEQAGKLDPNTCGYLHSTKTGNWTLNSEQEVFHESVKSADQLEQFACGLSYNAIFGRASGYLHFGYPGLETQQIDNQLLATTVERVLLLTLCILRRMSKDLFGDPTVGPHSDVSRQLDSFLPDPLLAAFVGKANKGDLVLLVDGRFGTVLQVVDEITHPKTGYVAYDLDWDNGKVQEFAPASDIHLIVEAGKKKWLLDLAVELGQLASYSTDFENEVNKLLNSMAASKVVLEAVKRNNVKNSIFG